MPSDPNKPVRPPEENENLAAARAAAPTPRPAKRRKARKLRRK